MRELRHPTHHRTWTEVDLAAIEDNVRAFCAMIGPDCGYMQTLKADAYGHGAVQAAGAAIRGGATRLGVATCMEGQTLREAGIGVPVHILGNTLPEEVDLAVRLGLTISIHDLYTAQLVAIAAHKHGRTVPVHLKIDSGMGRLGILPDNAPDIAVAVAAMPGVVIEAVFMHFAEADHQEYSDGQIDLFDQTCRRLEDAGIKGFFRHVGNSVGTILHPRARYEMVRPGCGGYGFLAPSWPGERITLHQALSWRSCVIHVKDYPAGHSLGYDRTFATTRPTRVAVLPLGYADGYRREFSNKAEVILKGRRAPVVGRVSMDYTMVDVTDLPPVDVGAVATLLGGDGEQFISLDEMAEWGGTIPYCVATGISPRVGRIYVENETDNL